MKILVTCFEPFGGEGENASREAVSGLPGKIGGAEIAVCCLPVSFARAVSALYDAMERCSPDAVLSVGQAGGTSQIAVECVAVNLMEARMPDNDGHMPRGVPVVQGGPGSYRSMFPAERIAAAIGSAGVPVRLSDSAGTYVCNTVMYALLHRASSAGHPGVCGFIHVPAMSGKGTETGENVQGMELGEICRGLEIALRVIAGE